MTIDGYISCRILRKQVTEMCLPFSRLNGDWMVTEMRLKSTFPVTIQSPFSHHSVTIQSTERLHFILWRNWIKMNFQPDCALTICLICVINTKYIANVKYAFVYMNMCHFMITLKIVWYAMEYIFNGIAWLFRNGLLNFKSFWCYSIIIDKLNRVLCSIGNVSAI